jgi:hypothetical protein
VPVDLINIGHWLRLLLGAPTTTGSTNFIHTFGSGAASLPSNAMEIGYPDVPSFDVCTGVRADIRADRRVEGVDPGIARCTGQITVRFENTTLLAQAQAGTSAVFALAFTIDANRSLTITLHEVYLALAKTPIEGPAGVEASFDFKAAFNATATRMMTAVLRNQQAGTEYA